MHSVSNVGSIVAVACRLCIEQWVGSDNSQGASQKKPLIPNNHSLNILQQFLHSFHCGHPQDRDKIGIPLREDQEYVMNSSLGESWTLIHSKNLCKASLATGFLGFQFHSKTSEFPSSSLWIHRIWANRIWWTWFEPAILSFIRITIAPLQFAKFPLWNLSLDVVGFAISFNE